MQSVRQQDPGSELKIALRQCRSGLIGIGLFTAIINVLVLTGSVYMLQVYDRVLPSQSIPTLIALSVIAIVLFVFQGLFDSLRGRMLTRIGIALDEAVSRRAFEIIVQMPLISRKGLADIQPLRDLDQVRGFLSSPGPTALFDLPWIPLYLLMCFMFHPMIGVTAIIGSIVLIGLALATEVRTRGPMEAASLRGAQRLVEAEVGRRNAETLRAMGMTSRIRDNWWQTNRAYLVSNQQAADVSSGLGSASRVFRLMLQSAVLAAGAVLVVEQLATPGIMIASSILVARALAPVELSISYWKHFIAARLSWKRLSQLLKQVPPRPERLQLSAPRKMLTVEGVAIAVPGERRPIVENVGFTLEAGAGLGIIGRSGSGKSTLVRALVGVWAPLTGNVRFDGAAINQWDPDHLGRSIGYLPQDVELLPGTLAQNIARFEQDADPDMIVAAARAAGVHELILSLPEGYDTVLRDGGSGLSGGQRQRVALARALYGDPFVVVLDEPNSNLDSTGEIALTEAIASVRARGGIAIVVAHRPSALAAVDQLLVLEKGRVAAMGEKESVLKQISGGKPARRGPAPADAQIVGS